MNDYQQGLIEWHSIDYQGLIELWDANLESAVGTYLNDLLNGSFATTIDRLIGEIWDYLISYSCLFNPDGIEIEKFTKALCVKMILELDFPDVDASSLWHRALEKLNPENQKMLRLIPDDTLLKAPDEEKSPKAPDDYLKQTVKSAAAKDHSLPEIYEDLFASVAAMLNSYTGAISELRNGLISEIIIDDEILKEEI